ncbi:MAG: hypothetical protein GX610_23820 [Rhodococcus sp.]|nr:hypothetical protein [Rhodococcus sp. (in: high G+C Gram-positive bacteria)]
MTRTADRETRRLPEWMTHGVLDTRVSRGLIAFVFLLTLIGAWNGGTTWKIVGAAVCLVAALVGFVLALVKNKSEG